MLDMICPTTDCWSATGDMMAGWGAIAGALAVAYAAYKATGTFEAYRRQKQEDRRIEAAERILTLAYSFKRTLIGVRSPMSTGGESHEAREQLEEGEWFKGLDERQKRMAVIGQVALRRLNQQKQEWEKIIGLMPLARALFGEHVEARLQTLWQQVVEVSVSAEMYQDDAGGEPEITRKMERDFWGAGGDRDIIANTVDVAIKELESELLPIIRASPPPKADTQREAP